MIIVKHAASGPLIPSTWADKAVEHALQICQIIIFRSIAFNCHIEHIVFDFLLETRARESRGLMAG